MSNFLHNIAYPLLVTFGVLIIFVGLITFFSGIFDWFVYFLMDLG